MFNLLTGQSPRNLVDERGQAPHVSNEARFRGSIKEDPRWKFVIRIFDVGFALNIDFRFESAQELIQALRSALSPEPVPPGDFSGAVADYGELIRAGVAADHLRRKREMREASLSLELELSRLAVEVGLQSVHNAGYTVITMEGTAIFNITLRQEDIDHPSVYLKHHIELVGERKNKFRAYYQIDNSDELEYFIGIASDFTSLKEHVHGRAGYIFNECLRGLNAKIRSEGLQQVE